MKKIKIITITTFILLTGGLLLNNCVNATTVEFTDSHLYSKVKSELTSQSITYTFDDVAQSVDLDTTLVTSLYLNGYGITDLSGIEKFTSLVTLRIQNNNISDLSSLSSLTNLETIIAEYNNITDLSPLTTLNSLESLDLTRNHVVDLTPISGLINLTLLDVAANNVVDVSPLKTLVNLEALYLDSNNISDISNLNTLTKLEEGRIDNNNISDISVFTNFTNLTLFRIGINPISDISPLLGLANLISMNAYNIKLSKNISTTTTSIELPEIFSECLRSESLIYSFNPLEVTTTGTVTATLSGTTLNLTGAVAGDKVTVEIPNGNASGTEIEYTFTNSYNITINNPTNGTVVADKTTAIQGETVTLTATPNNGYKLKSLTAINRK